jgi:hypothetical protein
MSLARPLARQTKTPARTLGLMVAVICEARQTASQRRRKPQARRCSSGRRFALRKSIMPRSSSQGTNEVDRG